MEAEQKKTPIKNRFMADLLKEDNPAGVVAGDRAQQTNPAPSDRQVIIHACQEVYMKPLQKADGEVMRIVAGERAQQTNPAPSDHQVTQIEEVVRKARQSAGKA